jgi:hypothetical protein
MVLEFIQYISILIEVIIAIIGLMIVFQKKKNYGWGIFLTFAIYVFYDFAKLVNYNISLDILYLIFFIASLSALIALWMIFKDKRK